MSVALQSSHTLRWLCTSTYQAYFLAERAGSVLWSQQVEAVALKGCCCTTFFFQRSLKHLTLSPDIHSWELHSGALGGVCAISMPAPGFQRHLYLFKSVWRATSAQTSEFHNVQFMLPLKQVVRRVLKKRSAKLVRAVCPICGGHDLVPVMLHLCIEAIKALQRSDVTVQIIQ